MKRRSFIQEFPSRKTGFSPQAPQRQKAATTAPALPSKLPNHCSTAEIGWNAERESRQDAKVGRNRGLLGPLAPWRENLNRLGTLQTSALYPFCGATVWNSVPSAFSVRTLNRRASGPGVLQSSGALAGRGGGVGYCLHDATALPAAGAERRRGAAISEGAARGRGCFSSRENRRQRRT